MLYRNVLALCLTLLSLPVLAQDDQYLQQLIQQARALHLSDRIEWQNLLHYKPKPFFPGKSVV